MGERRRGKEEVKEGRRKGEKEGRRGQRWESLYINNREGGREKTDGETTEVVERRRYGGRNRGDA